MRKVYHLMAIAIAAVAFSACEKEPAFLADVTYPEEANGNAIVVDAWSNNFTLDIKSDGEWRIESADFITVKPGEGKGNATVKVYVEDNEEEQRLKGNVTIVFPGHEGQNKTLALEQKWLGEYGENADQMSMTNKVYAIGYGYDTTKGLYANFDCLKAQIFKSGELIAEGLQGYGSLNMNAVLSTVTGSSISDISNKLTVKANAGGGVGKFKAEANASFTMNYTDNSTHEYAINYLEATLTTATFDLGIEDLATEEWMTSYAYKNINGLNDRYSSDKDGFARLIRTYGTHVVMSARLGGRVRQSLDVDISKISTSYDLNVFAKASYEGVFANAGGSVNDDFHDSFNDNSEAMTITVQALGGDMKLAKALVAKDGFTKDNYKAWLESVEKDNMTLMGFVDDDSLIPLYDLVDKTKYPRRYQDLYDYMHGKDIEETFVDNSTYDTGTVTAFDVPTFSDSSNDNSLVKDIMLSGQQVGIVCSEYIPIIDKNKRITVVYPIIGSSVRYNMGFFIGDADHKPARVAWNGTDTNISEYTELNFGNVTKLYLRGASITATSTEDIEIREGTLREHKVSAMGYRGTTDYPVVKIFNQLWMRKSFRSNMYNNGLSIACAYGIDPEGKINDGPAFYSHAEASNALFAPSGWHVNSKSDYQAIKGLLEAKGVTHISVAKAFFPDKMGGVLGFHETFSGGWWSGTQQNLDKAGYYGCINSKGQYEGVCQILKNGLFDPAGPIEWSDKSRFPVRLVQKLF